MARITLIHDQKLREFLKIPPPDAATLLLWVANTFRPQEVFEYKDLVFWAEKYLERDTMEEWLEDDVSTDWI